MAYRESDVGRGEEEKGLESNRRGRVKMVICSADPLIIKDGCNTL